MVLLFLFSYILKDLILYAPVTEPGEDIIAVCGLHDGREITENTICVGLSDIHLKEVIAILLFEEFEEVSSVCFFCISRDSLSFDPEAV